MTTVAVPLLRLATPAMGTRFELVLQGDDQIALRAAGESALAEIERLHNQLTRFSADSLLSHINRAAADSPIRLDAQTYALFEDAQAVYHAADGAFDCTLGTGMQRMVLDPAARSIAFSQSGITLDLGAIAKGHALDCAAGVLRAGGVRCALLHGGTSSVLALGAPVGESAWRIRLAHHASGQIVELRDAALAVSCTLGDRRHNMGHILDPRTRNPIGQERYAAAIGPSARLADAWTTALVVLGRRPVSLGAEWTTYLW